MPEVRPYGSWSSPIDAAFLTTGSVGFSAPTIDGDRIFWLESRPAEEGRVALVRRTAGGPAEDVLPRSVNVRTSVHEYGGGAYTVSAGTVVYCDFADQRMYRHDGSGEPVPITPVPPQPRSLRYADARIAPGGGWLVCVRERHEDGRVINELVSVPLDGASEPTVIASGRDFYAAPRFSPDGTKLAYLAWDQPNMPWDGTELFEAAVSADGSLGVTRLVAGGASESVFQPEWSLAGVLHFVSDRTGWWNIYADGSSGARDLTPRDEEFGYPAWLFGWGTYAFLADGRIICIRETEEGQRVGILDSATGELMDLDLPFSVFQPSIVAAGSTVVLMAGGPKRPAAVVAIDLLAADVDVLAEAAAPPFDPAYLSAPRPIAFPTERGLTAYAYHYAPANPDFTAPEGELPPLIVLSHGGPTASVGTELNLEIQFFTSRGFAVVDVNYGGSTGHGRAYRERLNGSWGIVDVEDCANAARYLVERGLADPERLVASGGSAGGWTTLCLLTFRDEFAGGTSYYGVADLSSLAEHTHKFEARYFDSLVGPWPESRALFDERSPLHHTDRLERPMLVLQGLEDRVVPPAQSESLVAALAAKRIPHAYVAFEGEGHGFRKAENIVRSLQSELSFYSQVLGFPHPEGVPVLPLSTG